MKAAGGVFHDRHTEYSGAVKKLLNKISTRLFSHLKCNCPICGDSDEVPPPYMIKSRLYRLSRYFKMRLRGKIIKMKRPWATSDKWKGRMFSGGSLSPAFEAKMDRAEVEDRR